MGVSIGEGHATYPMLADQAPVSLGATITGIDDRNVGLLVSPLRLRTRPVPAIAQEALALIRLHTGPSSPVGSARSAQGARVVTIRNYLITYTGALPVKHSIPVRCCAA